MSLYIQTPYQEIASVSQCEQPHLKGHENRIVDHCERQELLHSSLMYSATSGNLTTPHVWELGQFLIHWQMQRFHRKLSLLPAQLLDLW